MKLDRQKKQLLILCVLLGVLAFSLYRLLFSTVTTQGGLQLTTSSTTSSGLPLDLKDIYLSKGPKKTGNKKEISFQEVDPSLHLEKLTDFNPGTPLNARNMFSVAASPNIPALNTGSDSSGAGRQDAGSSVNPNPAPVRPPAVIINLKFYGTKTDLADRKRHGFFADGDEVYLASEGDLVASRYRVIRIGDSSAEIEEVSSKTRRQISLTQ